MIIRLLKQFAENKYVNLLSGLILFTTAAIDIVHSLDKGGIGTRHGVAIFALLHILKTLPDVLHGAENISKMGD